METLALIVAVMQQDSWNEKSSLELNWKPRFVLILRLGVLVCSLLPIEVDKAVQMRQETKHNIVRSEVRNTPLFCLK